jgi:uncharacterized protein (UPF0248 family)
LIGWPVVDTGGREKIRTLKWHMNDPSMAYVVTVEADSAEDALHKIQVDIVPELRRQVVLEQMDENDDD